MFKKRLGEKLGSGGEKDVYVNQENPDRAVGMFNEGRDETTFQIKGRFYLTKILHLLYPKQIPDIHLAASDPHMIEVDRVIIGKKFNDRDKKAEMDRDLLTKKFENLGVIPDYYRTNFGYDQEGNLVYLDSVDPFQGNECFYDPEKIKAALEQLENDKKEQGLVFLKRLEALRMMEEGFHKEIASSRSK